MPAGEIGYAVGVEYRSLSVRDEQDSQSNSGNITGAYGGDTVGERTYKAMYLETEIPITKDLILTAATRYDDYSLPNQGQLSSSAGLRYQVLDSLVIRASFGEGFRVADIQEVQGEESVGYHSVVDTKYCNPVPFADRATSDLCDTVNIPVRGFANPNLEPEISTQYSTGLVWDITEDAAITLDYWTIEIENQIKSISATTILDEEYLGNLGNYSGLYVNRDLTEKREEEIQEIGSTVTNYLGLDTSGVDVTVATTFDLGGVGELTFNFEGSYVLEYEFQKTSTDPVYDYVGYYGQPEMRANFSIGYNYEDLNSFITARYIDGYKGETPEEEANGEEWIDDPSLTTVDIGVRYNFGTVGEVSLIVRNMFDKLPPINTDYTQGYNASLHSIIGRTVQLSYRATF